MADMDRQVWDGQTFMLRDSEARTKSLFNYGSEEYASCDDVDKNSILFVSSSGGVRTIPDFPIDIFNGIGWLITIKNETQRMQMAISWRNTKENNQIKYRTCTSGTWMEWVILGFEANTMRGWANDAGIESCDDVDETSWYIVSSEEGITNPEDFPFNRAGYLHTIVNGNFRLQFAVSFAPETYGNNGGFKVRTRNGSEYDEWRDVLTLLPGRDNAFVGFNNDITNYYSDLNDVDKNVAFFISTTGGAASVDHYPLSEPGLFTSFVGATNLPVHIIWPYYPETTKPVVRSKHVDGTWSSWVTFGGSGGGSTTTITEEVSRDTYNIEYNIETSPNITTDSNGWLQPIDTETEDETGKTDMSGAIMSMLTATGYCHLAPGIFYVSGNINLPEGATLEGCGEKTIIRLLDSVSSGYICRVHTKSTIRGIRFSGGYNQLDISNGNIGGRKGIIYIGNRDGADSGVTPRTTTCCMITDCWFENLDSGIYGYNAGGGLQEGMICSNCYITRCKAGINIDYWTEYCKFTNIITFQCYYACINNGGNNVFTACTFHGVIGFMIDNSSGTKANSAHGTVNGCTFNHIDNMNHPETLGNGYGVKVIGTDTGFIFANCQFWYSKVYVERAQGVQFSDCEFGGYPTIETSGNMAVFFTGCIFQKAPTKEINSVARFDNCYTYAGVAV